MSRFGGFASWQGFLAVLGVSTAAEAQEVNLIELTWSAPPGCPGALVVERRVIELTGALTRSTPLRAKADVSVIDGGVRLHLETQDAGQTFVRDVQLPSCDQAAETAALIFAMALRAELQTPPLAPVASPTPVPLESSTVPTLPLPPPPLPEPAPAPASPAAVPAVAPEPAPAPAPAPAALAPPLIAPKPVSTPAEPEPTPAVESLPTRDFAASLAGTVAWSLVPASLWAVTASGAWLPLPWRFEVTGSFAPAQRYALTSDTTRGGEFVWWSAGARGCYSLHEPQAGGSPLGAFVCVGGEGGQLRGVGFGTTLDEAGVSPWVAVNGGLGGVLALIERVRLLVRMELAAPLWRDRFVLQSTESPSLVARPGTVVAKLGLGVEVPF